ncbi:unnamed protein product [Candidatus Protochlamydia amoebophila UWE25]|uniref:Uncharacterized protein n=1 Tax=Protochlamydia amoebophila (strain UWE25) TaxID=264201 RepID=Q6MD94_PARUW|nr:unnamed protein product [Candidatus Protochlamydia amoebophila UWE25]
MIYFIISSIVFSGDWTEIFNWYNLAIFLGVIGACYIKAPFINQHILKFLKKYNIQTSSIIQKDVLWLIFSILIDATDNNV